MTAAAPWAFHFIANDLALDFADTVSWRGSAQPIERLADYAAVLSWAVQSGLIDGATERRLRRRAAAKPAAANRAHRRALRLRNLLYRLFADIADGGKAAAPDLARLSRLARQSFGRVALIGQAPPYRLGWPAEPDALEPVLAAVIRAAVALLSSDAVDKLRKCGSPRCGWLFLDVSRGGRRRWCAMWACGNRAKASRFYRRHAA
jgi:predicted RNA-binding Zn ribbon-like protein